MPTFFQELRDALSAFGSRNLNETRPQEIPPEVNFNGPRDFDNRILNNNLKSARKKQWESRAAPGESRGRGKREN